MSLSEVIDFEQPIALFPINQCVLLPHVAAPLHIFEPRYRAMTHDALVGGGLIAMAMFDGEEWRENYVGNPPIREHVCVGRIARHERLPDGRYNLLLQGLCRARVAKELPLAHGGYREAFLEPTESPDVMEIDLAEARQRVRSLLDDHLMRQLRPVAALLNWLEDDVPTSAMLDLTVMALCTGLEPRYAMLSEPRADRRAAWVETHLRRTRRTLRLAESLGSATDDDGLPLN